MKAMILAAGRGQRLRPLTDTIPKPLVRVMGKPLIVYHLEMLAARGIVDIVINYAWLGHMLVDYLGDGHRFGVNLVYSAETCALETGGGIKQALPLLGKAPFLVINGDIFIDALPALPPLVDDQLAHLWLAPNPPYHSGDFVLHGHHVKTEGDPNLTFTGMGVYHPALFADSPDGAFALAPLLRQKMILGQITGSVFEGNWCDVGTLERLNALERRLHTKGCVPTIQA